MAAYAATVWQVPVWIALQMVSQYASRATSGGR